MNAAESLFLAKGVEQTTVEQITRRGDVAKGTFYLHFATKADVVVALRDRFVDRLLDAVDVAVAQQSPADWAARLSAWARACAAAYLEAERLHHLVFVAAPPPTRDGLTRNPLIDSLTALLDAGAHAGAWTVEDPRFTAVFLFNALHGVVNQPGAAGTPASSSRLLLQIGSHFLRVAAAKP